MLEVLLLGVVEKMFEVVGVDEIGDIEVVIVVY